MTDGDTDDGERSMMKMARIMMKSSQLRWPGVRDSNRPPTRATRMALMRMARMMNWLNEWMMRYMTIMATYSSSSSVAVIIELVAIWAWIVAAAVVVGQRDTRRRWRRKAGRIVPPLFDYYY